MTTQIVELQDNFNQYRASVAGAVAGLEPEMVLVIKIVGSVEDFKQAVEATGLEWLGEWGLDDIEPSDDFHALDTHGLRKDTQLDGRMFLSLSNENSLLELLSLWNQWRQQQRLPLGKMKWRDVFERLIEIRRWGIEETLIESGMIDRWEHLIDPEAPDQMITFQIELFYRRNAARRQANERAISSLLAEAGGRVISSFVDMESIAFHAVKAELPARCIQRLCEEINTATNIDIHLFKFPGVMYFRPTGQSLVVAGDDEGEPSTRASTAIEHFPVAALLDGLPLNKHELLNETLIVDDIFELEQHYLPSNRKHGTSMASLIVHGDLNDESHFQLQRKLYCIPIMQPNPNTANRDEHVPENVFLEDRLLISIRRMFEEIGNTPPQAPDVKIINLSIGDSERPFIHTPSPLARLIDWLSWKYRVLFCVSAGNYSGDIDTGMSHTEFSALSDAERIECVLKSIAQTIGHRRLLSPAEALNVLTIGCAHSDASGEYPPIRRTDLLPSEQLLSPASRVGHGFRRAIKPEILLPGGRQLYKTPHLDRESNYSIDQSKVKPGLLVAWDSAQAGTLNYTAQTRGTSNATALATRGGVRIYEMLSNLREEEGTEIPENLTSVLIKALLVHGARHSDEAKQHLTAALRTGANSARMKEVTARFIGYGTTDIDRVLACTEQRATVLGCGEIRENEIHEYSFPIPVGLSEQKIWRRLIVTLAWLSPINPDHRNLREAKLALEPGGTNWKDSQLKLNRQDTDHNQVKRGTVQHEVLEAKNQIAAFQDGTNIRIRIVCKKDATDRLDEIIPYGLAVTLEVKEDVQIPIYQQIKTRLRPQVVVGSGRG